MKEIINSSASKYSPFKKIELTNRKWPENQITHPPIWCSVDLRDGNQALIEPMGIDKKLRFFSMLVELGFKQIEIGFPSASETEFKFVRELVNQNLIPDDVQIQVLTQSREHLIEKTFESVADCKKVILHLYNSTVAGRFMIDFLFLVGCQISFTSLHTSRAYSNSVPVKLSGLY